MRTSLLTCLSPFVQDTAAILDWNSDVLTFERIKREERLVRDRNAILLSHKKNFSGILAMLAKPKDDAKRKGEATNGGAVPAGERYANGKETEQFWKGYAPGGGGPVSLLNFDQFKIRDTLAASNEQRTKSAQPVAHEFLSTTSWEFRHTPAIGRACETGAQIDKSAPVRTYPTFAQA